MVKIESNPHTGKYTYEQLLSIMRRLRAPDGCPWDRVQTHRSIRNNLLEECYETVEAIDRDDPANLKEELGDVLMQVVFHGIMAEEEGAFTPDDVVDELCRKLVFRHPHVFGEVTAETPEEVLDNWEALKRVEKAQVTFSDTLNSVPKAFPALMRCAKVQKRAAKAGIDESDSAKALAFVKNRVPSSETVTAEQIGGLLFAVVALARKNGIDAEQALQACTAAFVERFSLAEDSSSSLPQQAQARQFLFEGV